MTAAIDTMTWVAALDGGKLLLWRNEGFDDQPNLLLLEEHDPGTPASRELGTDRPGRMSDDGHNQHSAMDETDLHKQVKNRFIRAMVEKLNEAAEAKKFDRLVLLAPAKVLGAARPHYSDKLADRLIEHPRDVVNQPMDKIEARVIEALKG